jgi:uncharacterized caspase-like protein
MLRLLTTVAIIVLWLIPARADRRVALIVGNGNYQHADKLTNPITDARNMRNALAKLGFDIVFGEDHDKRTLERSIGRFAVAVQGEIGRAHV